MQIFSKLQRNSANYLSLKLVFLVFIALLNSSFVYMPLMIGSVVFCEDLIVIAFYLGVFSVFHNFSLKETIFLFAVALFFKLFLYKKILEYVNPTYQAVVSIMFVYSFLFFIFGVNNFILIYLLYNVAFDIVLVRIFKCEPT